MAEPNSTQIEIVARLRDETEAGFQALAARIADFEARIAKLGAAQIPTIPAAQVTTPLPTARPGETQQEFAARNQALLAQVGALQLAAEATQKVAVASVQVETALVGVNAIAGRAFATVSEGARRAEADVQRLVAAERQLGTVDPTRARVVTPSGVPAAANAPLSSAIPVGASSAFAEEQIRKLRAEAALLRTDLVALEPAALKGLGAVTSGASGATGATSQLGTTVGSVSLGAVGGFLAISTAVSALTSLITEAAAESAKIDKTLAPIAAQSEAAAASIETVRQNVRDLRAETGRSIDDVAGLAAATAEFGKQADVEFQRVILRASDAGLGSAQQTLDRLKRLALGFGDALDAENFERIGDTIKSVSDLVGVSTGTLADATAQSAAAADDYNVSLEALAVTIGNATKRTGDQSQSAAQARAALKQLGDETSALNNIMQANGVEITRATLAGNGFAKVSQEIAAVLNAQPELRSELPDRLATFFESQTDALAQTAAAAASAAGAVRAASDRVQQTADQQAARAGERFDELKNSIVETFVPLNTLKVEIGKLFNDLDNGKAIELPPLIKLLSAPAAFADILTKFNQLRELSKLEGEGGALGKLGKKLEIPFAPFTALVDLLGKANDEIEKVDANFASRLEEARRVATLGATGGVDTAENPGETVGAQFALDFNAASDKRIEVVSDAALDRGQQRIRALLERFAAQPLTLPLDLQPVIVPEDLEAATKRLAELQKKPTLELQPTEKVEVEALTERITRYQDALKTTSDVAQRASLTIAEGFEKQRLSIENSRASTIRQLEAARNYVKEADSVIAAVNRAADAETRRIHLQERAASLAGDNARLAALAQELQSVAQLSRARGDAAQAERDEIEVLRQKAEITRTEIEAAREKAIIDARGSENEKARVADANATAESKLRTLALDERAAALNREQARERRNVQAEQQLQAARDETLRGLDAELAAIRRNRDERARAAAEEARTNPEKAAKLPALQQAIQASADSREADVRRNASLAVRETILRLELETVATLEEQFRLENELLRIQQERAGRAFTDLGADGFEQDVLKVRQQAERDRQAVQQVIEQTFGRGVGFEVVLQTRFELNRTVARAQLQRDIDKLIAELQAKLLEPELRLDPAKAKAAILDVDRAVDKLIAKKKAAEGSFFDGVLGSIKQEERDALSDAELGAQFARDSVQSLRGSLADFLVDLGDGKADVDKFFQAFIDGSQRAAAEALSNRLVDSFISFIGGAIGGASTPDAETNLFARGGIMTSQGPVPLRQYAGGGIANNPQLALFGEGSVPEAYVPVPSGRIPVEIRGLDQQVRGGGESLRIERPITLTVHVTHAPTFYAPDQPTFRAQLAQESETVTGLITQNLRQQIRGGGGLKGEIQRAARG